MPTADPQLPFWLALVVVGILGFAWQLYRVGRLGRRALAFPHAAFWVSAAAWTTLGLHAHAPDFPLQPPVLWRWVVPAGGLLATALLRWIAGVLPHLVAEDEPRLEPVSAAAENGAPNGRREEADLDAEDRQLLGRMRALLGKRAADLMVPVAEVATVQADADVEAVLATLARSGARRAAVLDATCTRSLGVIDGLELVVGAFGGGDAALGAAPPPPATPGGPAPSTPPLPRRARQLCRPIPAVPGWRPAHEALEVLRTGGTGLTAIVDGRDRVQGFLAWRPLLQTLLGRPLRGGRL